VSFYRPILLRLGLLGFSKVCRFRVNASVRVMLRLSFSDRDGIRLPDVELVEFYVGILTYSSGGFIGGPAPPPPLGDGPTPSRYS